MQMDNLLMLQTSVSFTNINYTLETPPILFIKNKNDFIESNYYMQEKNWWEIWTRSQENISPLLQIKLKTHATYLSLLNPIPSHCEGNKFQQGKQSKWYRWKAGRDGEGDGFWRLPSNMTQFKLPSCPVHTCFSAS